MPRTGRHPLKDRNLILKEPESSNITVITITHIPTLGGYWEESLEVLKLFFKSLYQSTELTFDLMVFDNASCREVTVYLSGLKEEGMIQYLVLSDRNFRKLGALDFLLRAAQGKFVTYADSDVYFLPGWLEKSLEVLHHFPQAGMVSALPTVDKLDKYLGSTMQGIENDPEIEVVRGNNIIPNEFIKAHRLSLGKSEDTYINDAFEQALISKKNIRTFISAQDFQFTTTKAVIKKVLPLQIETLDEVYDPIYSPVFEQKVDALGYWRLSTSEYLVHHMGNHVPNLSEELAAIAPDLKFDNNPVVEDSCPRQRKWWDRIFESYHFRKVVKTIYTWSYKILFEK